MMDQTFMTKYAIRSCTKCGRKKPANRIYAKLVDKTYKGSSRRSINILTWLGLLFGDKGAQRAIKQWLFQSTNRKYSGRTTIKINLCSLCYHRVPSSQSGNGFLKILFFGFYIPYKIFKFLLTSPLVRESIIYLLSALVWFILKLSKILGYFGLKILDQDGDRKIDKKDFDIAYNKVSSFLAKLKEKK
jgi:hypothetical protein